MTELSIQILEYRNGIYQGGVLKGRREGKGILIADEGQIFVASWKNDQLNDKTLIWNDQKDYVIGDFNRGIMEGDFVYRGETSTFYATFVGGKINGKQVYIDRKNGSARVTEFKNLNYRVIEEFDIRPYGDEESRIFRQALGYDLQLPTLTSFIESEMVGADKNYLLQTLPTGNRFIAYNRGDTVEKLGFTFMKEELLSYGVYVDSKLEGVGCKYENKTKYEGVFKLGLLNGFGLKYQILQNKYTVGLFINGNLKEESDSEPQTEKGLPDLSKVKRNIHMQSLFFYNSFVRPSAMLKHKGYEETVIKTAKPQKEILYADTVSRSTAYLNKNNEYSRFANIQPEPITLKNNASRVGPVPVPSLNNPPSPIMTGSRLVAGTPRAADREYVNNPSFSTSPSVPSNTRDYNPNINSNPNYSSNYNNNLNPNPAYNSYTNVNPNVSPNVNPNYSNNYNNSVNPNPNYSSTYNNANPNYTSNYNNFTSNHAPNSRDNQYTNPQSAGLNGERPKTRSQNKPDPEAFSPKKTRNAEQELSSANKILERLENSSAGGSYMSNQGRGYNNNTNSPGNYGSYNNNKYGGREEDNQPLFSNNPQTSPSKRRY